MPEHLSLSTLLILEAGCLAAYFLKGFSGFGPAMLFIPTVTLLYNPELALAGSTFIDLFVGLGLLITLRFTLRELKIAFQIIVCLAIGNIAGGTLAGALPENIIQFCIGVIISAFGIMLLIYNQPIPERLARIRRRWLWPGAVVSGITGGLVGISGPFIIMVCRPQMDKDSFRRMMILIFFAEKVVRMSVYLAVDVWSAEVFKLAMLASPAVLVGLIVGARYQINVSERHFSAVIGTLLLLVGIRVLMGTF